MEDKEKFFVQYQIEVKEGKTYYNTFLEISKYKRFRSFDAFKAGESPEFKTTIHECIPTKEVIKVFDILESVHSIY